MYRTRACSQCGHRITLRGMKVLGRADFPKDAVSLMQEMKKKDFGKK
jgi:pentatricopeptide repeat protein